MKKKLQINIAVNETVLRPTQSSVIQIIHRNVDLKCFFSSLPKCFFVIIVIGYMHISFIFHKVV